MKSNKEKLLVITNLYPLPWEPNRATFNRQQFAALAEDYDISFLIPIAFIEWFKHRNKITQTDSIRYFPYFFSPKVGRRFYAIFMFISMLIHSLIWLKRIKPNKIFATWAFPDAVAAGWLSKLLKCPFYFKVHGSDIDIQCQHNARAKQVKNISQHARGIASVSQALADKMAKFGVEKSKIKVIYNGVDHDKFNQATSAPIDQPYLLFIGNLKLDKGVMELLEGYANSAALTKGIKLVFAGNGAMMGPLNTKVTQLGIQDKVIFLGSINHDQVPVWLQHAQLLALPSYHEGVPNVLLEAMASGIPVIATNVGGIPEVVNEKICGKLFAPQNSTAVSEAINHVLLKDWSVHDIKRHSQNFSWQKNKMQLIELIERN